MEIANRTNHHGIILGFANRVDKTKGGRIKKPTSVRMYSVLYILPDSLPLAINGYPVCS
jgi:hypothetical protein